MENQSTESAGPIRRVGYIGLGNMGRPIATNIRKGGFELTVFDLRPEPLQELAKIGANIATSPRDLGAQCDLVELSVVDDAQVEEVILGENGVLSGARPGTVIAIHSTIHPRTAKHAAEQAIKKGVCVLDAQVSGGSHGAEAATLCYMVGGDKDAFERCRPVFEACGSNVFYMGAVGMGSVTKISQQVITCVTILAASEGFRIARTAGVDLEAFSNLVHVSAGQSAIADTWLERFQRMDAHMVELFYQGLRPALELAHELKVPVPGAALTQQLFPRIIGPEADA